MLKLQNNWKFCPSLIFSSFHFRVSTSKYSTKLTWLSWFILLLTFKGYGILKWGWKSFVFIEVGKIERFVMYYTWWPWTMENRIHWKFYKFLFKEKWDLVAIMNWNLYKLLYQYIFISLPSITRSWRSVHLLFTWRCGAQWTVSKLAQNWGNFSKPSWRIGIRHCKRYPGLTRTKHLILHILSRKFGISQNYLGISEYDTSRHINSK